MKNETLIGEQPLTQSITQEDNDDNTVQMRTQNVERTVDNVELKGSLGKFKDAQSLLTAYNNLQAEFTKKCQSLSELKAQSQENEKKEEKEPCPIYEKLDWTERVGAFLEKNKQAQPFAKDIANLLLQDKELAKTDSALDVAYARVISQSFVQPTQAIDDEKFVNDYILTSEKIKNAVLNLYFKELQNNKVPSVLNQTKRTSQVLYKTPQASSLENAKEIVKQMFN